MESSKRQCLLSTLGSWDHGRGMKGRVSEWKGAEKNVYSLRQSIIETKQNKKYCHISMQSLTDLSDFRLRYFKCIFQNIN